MSKNNFFVKFAYFYCFNIIKLKKNVMNAWDTIVGIVPEIVDLIADIIQTIVCIFFVFIPIKQIYTVVISKYLSDDEVKRITGVNCNGGNGYYRKKEIKEYVPKKGVEKQ
ncbi:MAG: hypothetical protein LBQ89_08145 [Treponema sp.]|jgi:hypothetical protein|nr:hypothetical protein [Treponema sp.]